MKSAFWKRGLEWNWAGLIQSIAHETKDRFNHNCCWVLSLARFIYGNNKETKQKNNNIVHEIHTAQRLSQKSFELNLLLLALPQTIELKKKRYWPELQYFQRSPGMELWLVELTVVDRLQPTSLCFSLFFKLFQIWPLSVVFFKFVSPSTGCQTASV